MSKSKKPPEGSIPEAMRPTFDAVVALTDKLCREHLNEEYAEMCRRLAGTLARKRPSPLSRGKPETWASGVVRVVGYVNFLDDPTQSPHMKFAEIDEAFGVSSSTAAAKAKAIRDLLKIDRFDPSWTLPSKIDNNPMVWMIQVNGFVMDVRTAPREIQEEALRKGLIPYLPDDRQS